jgi:hypothetical protein
MYIWLCIILAFMVTNISKIFSGYKPCQLVKNHRRFRDHLCPHHQISSSMWSLEGRENSVEHQNVIYLYNSFLCCAVPVKWSRGNVIPVRKSTRKCQFYRLLWNHSILKPTIETRCEKVRKLNYAFSANRAITPLPQTRTKILYRYLQD